MRLRPTTSADRDLLELLLVEAFNWTGEVRVTLAQVGPGAEHGHHLADWQRPTDLGVVAETDAGEPTGAAWARVVPASEAGYGFVGEDVPELGMAVLAPYRGRGVGSLLLDAFLARLKDSGHDMVSLSVEDGNNTARRLYEARGFRAVGRNGSSDTLLLTL
ncbi:GNAT family N-acetyltransferase [Cellulomonas chengniuliangii]|uniref:GNAT family N-acetyltransferase n=1 Tax=Cellulomonas chengniuliangii TaxID=2968084 RepID=UPI001D0E95F0|nr:GNAT family N-acetyltransferase [Cellulomonas chengniuliangii]MCC2318486.1 GNAT family N-acetyltransferase [Cellulomonas chengniuliangii]